LSNSQPDFFSTLCRRLCLPSLCNRHCLAVSNISFVVFAQIHLMASFVLCAEFGRSSRWGTGRGFHLRRRRRHGSATGPALFRSPRCQMIGVATPSIFVAPARPLPFLRPFCDLPEVIMCRSSAATLSAGGGPSHNGSLKLPFKVDVCPSVHCAWRHPPFVPDGHVACNSEH